MGIDGSQELLPAEKIVLDCAKAGQAAMITPDGQPPDDVHAAIEWHHARTVRADFLARLCRNPDACLVSDSGVQVVGAIITGTLCLQNAVLTRPMALVRCRVRDVVNLNFTRATSLAFSGSLLNGVFAHGLRLSGSLVLDQACHCRGGVHLNGARVDGQVICDGRFDHPTRVDGGRRVPDVTLVEAGKLLQGLNEQVAFGADGATVAGGILLWGGVHARGQVRLCGAHVSSLRCTGRIENDDGQALQADNLTSAGSVSLGPGLACTGGVSLAGADIAGQLFCTAKIHARQGWALNLSEANVRRSVFLEGLQINGPVSLAHAHFGSKVHISGSIQCSRFRHPDRLPDSLPCGRVDEAPALEMGGADASDILIGDVLVDGEVHAIGLHVAGQLVVEKAHLRARGGTALLLQGARVGGELVLWNLHELEGKLVLEHASCYALVDDLSAWPSDGNLALHGFTYLGKPRGKRNETASRLDWLDLQADDAHSLQPYEQLAAALRSSGDVAAAKQVGLARRRRARKRMRGLHRAWDRLLDSTARYGYEPGRALKWLVALVLLGALVFEGASSSGSVIKPAEAQLGVSGLVHSLQLVLPFVPIEADSGWQIAGGNRLVVAYRAFHVLVGWLLLTVLAASLAGLITTD